LNQIPGFRARLQFAVVSLNKIGRFLETAQILGAGGAVPKMGTNPV
jgi:hypothetical protein